MSGGEHGGIQPDKKLAAVCGLFCPSCTFYIGSMEEPRRLEALAQRSGAPVAMFECHGCRSDKRNVFCEKYCKMTGCAAEKGIDFCGECSEYPCDDLRMFRSQMPHRAELWESQEQIKRDGYEAWFAAMAERYSCRECGTMNSAYDLACRACGAEPSCGYVAEHRDEVAEFDERMRPPE